MRGISKMLYQNMEKGLDIIRNVVNPHWFLDGPRPGINDRRATLIDADALDANNLPWRSRRRSSACSVDGQESLRGRSERRSQQMPHLNPYFPDWL